MDAGEGHGKRPPGRPVDATLGPAIVVAVLDTLAAQGYAGLTTAEVARRAGVSTATLYRRWPSKRDLILAAAGQIGTEESAEADTGSTEGDLRVLLAEKQRVLSGRVGATLISLIGESAHDPELAAVVRAGILEPTRRRLAALFARSAARDPDGVVVDDDAAAHLVVGAILARLAFHAAIDPDGSPARELFSDSDMDLLVRALIGHRRGAGWAS